MGDHNVRPLPHRERAAFQQALLEDLRALERLLGSGAIESDILRIGAEQEMFLVDDRGGPLARAEAVLAELPARCFTPEVGLYNLEANAAPRLLGPGCFDGLRHELSGLVAQAAEAAAGQGAKVVLTGILPSLSRAHLVREAMVPQARYAVLEQATMEPRGEVYARIDGIDRFEARLDTLLLEACATSFQAHLQVPPAWFVRAYNASQLVVAPLVAAASNSPLLCGRRLWHETRIALLEVTADLRTRSEQARAARTRAGLGESWIKESVLEIYRQDVARFAPILTSDSVGKVPGHALALHLGTVWRWNRACFGTNGTPHLRIECRVMPSGPTIADEVANAAFWMGLVLGLAPELGDLEARLPFADALANLGAAAREGLKADLRWLDGRRVGAQRLLLDELVPLSAKALSESGVPAEEVSRHLGVVEARVRSGRTGSAWQLAAFERVATRAGAAGAGRAVAEALLAHPVDGPPVHTWELPKDLRVPAPRAAAELVKERPVLRAEDAAALGREVMRWAGSSYAGVEANDGAYVGVITRELPETGTVADAASEVPHVAADATPQACVEAMGMTTHGCVAVLQGTRLVGLVTKDDLHAHASESTEQG